MSKYLMVLDTETTGIPITAGFNKYYHPKELKYYDSARLVELGYIIYDDKGKEIKTVSHIVSPNNFSIDNWKIHGITNEIAAEEGIDINTVFDEFSKDLDNIDSIIGHNITFDMNVLLSEFYRHKKNELIDKFKNINVICTMKIGKVIMKQYKYPKLIELYSFLFNEVCNQEHRALSDVIICAKCFFYITENKLIVFDK